MWIHTGKDVYIYYVYNIYIHTYAQAVVEASAYMKYMYSVYIDGVIATAGDCFLEH
jgi:hypothetical protein